MKYGMRSMSYRSMWQRELPERVVGMVMEQLQWASGGLKSISAGV
jgi:hypothetical protein